MTSSDDKRAARGQLSRENLLPAMAAHVLAHGISGLSLRPLAEAAGTSDRMLIYHFGNKQQLIADLLAHLAQMYATSLDARVGETRAKTRKECIQRVLAETGSAEMEPFMAVWWEIVAGCARGVPGYRDAAGKIMEQLLAWLETQMPADDPDPQGGARYLLTLIEGTQMLGVVGQDRIARQGLVASGL